MKSYRIDVPKPAIKDPEGNEVRLYEVGEIVKAKAEWQETLMEAFVGNGWATEIKIIEPEQTTDPVKATIKAKTNRAPRKKAT